jgi:hypothetical protein
MMDAMLPGAPHVESWLERVYPNATFTIHNFGVGGSNLEQGIERLTQAYTYLGEQKPSVLSTKPDILVIESFAYNNFGPGQGGIDHQWLSLAKAIDVVKANSPETTTIIGATIAPNEKIFGDKAGLNFPSPVKRERARTIKTYLENATRFAKSQKLPIADAFHLSLDDAGEGEKKYIQDGIHPSGEGADLFAREIVKAILTHDLLR